MTNLWTINECPGYTVERTPGAWALWAPCKCKAEDERKEECPECGDSGEVVIAVCGIAADGSPDDKDMLKTHLPTDTWTPRRIQ